MRELRFTRLLPVLALVTACEAEVEPATAIVVSVKTDLMRGIDLTEVSYRIYKSTSDPEWDEPVDQFTAGAETLDRPFVILRGNAPELLLSVEGFRRSGEEAIITHRVRARFQTGKTLALHVFLSSRCLGRVCNFAAGLTCHGEPRGPVQPGDCAGIAGPDDLEQVNVPGDESQWTPLIGASLDGGVPQPERPFDPLDPSFSPELDGGLCNPLDDLWCDAGFPDEESFFPFVP